MKLKPDTRKDWMKSRIVSSLPGRLRLTVPGLELLSDSRGDIAKELAAIAGVRSARVTNLTSGVLLLYDERQLDARSLTDLADMVFARYAMTAFRASHSKGGEDSGEVSMSSGQLGRRLGVNAGALLLGNTVLRGSLFGGTGVLAHFTSLQALTSLGLCAPLARSAWDGVKRDMRPNADFLTVTSIVASLLVGSANSALTILALSDLAEFMTSYTIEKTRSSIKEMLSVEDGNAWKVVGDRLERCSVSELRAGDVVAAHTGEKLAVDGTVESGSAVLDQSAITGEFVPAEKHAGDPVFAGMVVKSGNLRIRADKVGDQTVVSRIVSMVEASELKKAPIQRYADRFSNYLVPLNFLLCAAVWLATKNPDKALKMLVIDYSCGIKLSTATAFSAAIQRSVKQGVLIKGGAYIEQIADADTVLLDKTGTITEGRPEIVSAEYLAHDLTREEIISCAMAAEETSTHPLGSAILAYGRALGVTPAAHGDVVTEVARGTRTVTADGHVVRVGSLKYMLENGVEAASPLPDPAGTIPNYVGIDNRIAAMLSAMDRPRENVRRAINALRYDGVGSIELLTGDMEAQAKTVAQQVGADAYHASLLPEEKANAVLKLQTKGNGVVMVGDGINDAPALAYADVGISLGSKSTDIAIETSDVVINSDDPMMIPELRRLSRETMQIVRQNFTLVIAINTVGLILGAASNVSVLLSAMMHNASTILVVANSLRLMLHSGQKGGV